MKSNSYLSLIEELSEVNERYELIGGYNYQGQTEKILQGLGFERTDFLKNTDTFSGGWRMKQNWQNYFFKITIYFIR